jgi:homoserine kinase type II
VFHSLSRQVKSGDIPPQALEEMWPLGGWVTLDRVPGGKNMHYRLHTRDGDFSLRRSHRTKARTDLVAQLELMRMLRLRGLPVPVAQPTVVGENHAVVDERVLDRDEGHRGPAVRRRVAGPPAAARAHPRALPRPHRGPRRRTWRTWAELRARTAAPGTPRAMAARGRRVADSLAHLTPDLPRAVVHGAARRGSFVFQGDRVVGVLDFDSAHPDVRVLDLAVAAHDVGKVYTEAGSADHKVRMDLVRVGTLLEAYTETRPLTPAEAAALPLLMEAKRLKRALGRVHRDRAGEPLSANDHAKIALEAQRIAWLDVNRDELTRTCESFVRRSRR